MTSCKPYFHPIFTYLQSATVEVAKYPSPAQRKDLSKNAIFPIFWSRTAFPFIRAGKNVRYFLV
jgi:hypothetical protein